jgi:HK97 family phage major capsid protein
MRAANLGDPDPIQDFYSWIRTGKGQIKKHDVYHDFGSYKAALQEGADDEGGYLVPADELGRIIAKRGETGLIDRLGVSTFTTDRDVFNIPTEGTAMAKFTIVAEEGPITAAENEPTFGQADVKIYNFKKLIKISEELMEDFNSGLEQFLSDALGRAWAATENYYLQLGNGSTAPQGIFVGGTAGLTLDAVSAIGAAEIPELLGKLKIAYRPGAVMIMNRTTGAYLRGLFGANGFTFPVSPSIITSGGDDLGIGYPVFLTEDAAAVGQGAKSMLFGNFALYGWVRNRSLRVRRLTELYAGNGQIGLLANFRAGGEVLQAEAFQYATHPTG